jgi:hypothetical protein
MRTVFCLSILSQERHKLLRRHHCSLSGENFANQTLMNIRILVSAKVFQHHTFIVHIRRLPQGRQDNPTGGDAEKRQPLDLPSS